MTTHRTSLSDRRGFSMFELLVTVLVTSIIGGTIVTLLMSQVQLSTTQNRNIVNQENLRDTLAFMGDELSNAGNNAEEPFFIQAASDQVEFVGDQDGDGSPDKVHYYATTATLYRSVYSTTDNGLTWTLQSTDPLLTNVYNLNFTYFAFNNVAPFDTSEITSVEIVLEIDTSLNTTAYTANKVAPEAMMRRVTIRNRML